jgi:hypothetical protein
MESYTEYFRQRLEEQMFRLKELECQSKDKMQNITCKKRKYEEAMGYINDYEVVQDPTSIGTQNKGSNWIDAYLENLSNKTK